MASAIFITAAVIMLAARIWTLTIDAVGPESSVRNLRQAQKDSSAQTLSQMWPPRPPQASGPWPPSRPPSHSSSLLILNTRNPPNQRPPGLLESPSSQFVSSKKPPGFPGTSSLRNHNPLIDSPSSPLFSNKRPPSLLENHSSLLISNQNSPGLFETSSSFMTTQRTPGLLEDPSKISPVQRPSGIFDSQPHAFKDDIKIIQSNFNTPSQIPNRVAENSLFNTQIHDPSRRKPQTFTDSLDTFVSQTVLAPQAHRENEFQIPTRVFTTENKQKANDHILGSSTQTQLTGNTNWGSFPILHSSGQPSSNIQKDKQLLSITDLKQTSSSGPQLFADFEPHKLQSPINQSSYDIEPIVQFSQSIEASEHHSTYHASPLFDHHASAISLTNGPDFGSVSGAFTTNYLRTTAAPEFQKKLTLKDILAEDCQNAKEVGYCASPPRYPSNQVSQVITRCAELLHSLYAPEPEDDDIGAEFNSSTKRTIERGNRQVWSWAHPGEFQRTVCDSDRRRIEPGYVQEARTGRWYVVLQAESLYQRVTVDICRAAGKPCTSAKCTRGSGFRNGSTKSSHCVQRYSYSHLITWDPDNPNGCPKMRVFRFPTSCVCYLTNA